MMYPNGGYRRPARNGHLGFQGYAQPAEPYKPPQPAPRANLPAVQSDASFLTPEEYQSSGRYQGGASSGMVRAAARAAAMAAPKAAARLNPYLNAALVAYDLYRMYHGEGWVKGPQPSSEDFPGWKKVLRCASQNEGPWGYSFAACPIGWEWMTPALRAEWYGKYGVSYSGSLGTELGDGLGPGYYAFFAMNYNGGPHPWGGNWFWSAAAYKRRIASPTAVPGNFPPLPAQQMVWPAVAEFSPLLFLTPMAQGVNRPQPWAYRWPYRALPARGAGNAAMPQTRVAGPQVATATSGGSAIIVPSRGPTTLGKDPHRERRPSKREKERKLKATNPSGAVLQFVSVSGEFADLIDDLYEAIPRNIRGHWVRVGPDHWEYKDWVGTASRAKAVWKNWDAIDFPTALMNFARSQGEDTAYGAVGQDAANAQREAGTPRKPLFGPGAAAREAFGNYISGRVSFAVSPFG